MPFKITYNQAEPRSIILSVMTEGSNKLGEGITSIERWLFIDPVGGPGTIKAFATFIVEHKTPNDPEDHWQILMDLMPEHASRIKEFIEAEAKKTLAPGHQENDDDRGPRKPFEDD